MVNVILPSTNSSAISSMRNELDEVYNIYIVYDSVPAELSKTNEIIYFTRLSAQIYLDYNDFMKLKDLVPELLQKYST